MRSTFGGLEISKRSLFAHQTALSTTGHNIANANTRGYSRQTVNFVAARPIEAPGFMRSNTPGQLGQSVEFDSIRRVRETFLDDQFMSENKYLGEWSVRRDTMEKLEAIINEPTDSGIRQTIESFWNSWQDLSKEPDNLTARAVVKERALAMVDAFNHTGKQLKDYAGDITGNINAKVTQINTFANQIASLNREIYRVEGLANDANDLRDQRDLIMDDLSKIVNVSLERTEAGYNVRMGAIQLVNGTTAGGPFTAEMLEAAVDSGDLSSGEVYGMFLSRDQIIPNYQLQLDSMIRAMVEGKTTITLPKGTVLPEGTVIDGTTYSGANRTLTSDLKVVINGVNGLHRLGYTLNPGVVPGGDFFVVKDGYDSLSAESVAVNPEIVANVRNIASSMRTYIDSSGTEQVVKGNGDMALLIAGIRNLRVNFDPDETGLPILTDGSFDEFFRAVVGQLGVQGQEAARQADNQTILVEQVDNRRQSVSGVSLDEEMANMIKFQHAYNAAARAMTAVDEMLDKVINGMGVVGR
ncbi:flagellar hook-associated protein FlgK [Paenibacillus alkalitolerans]|uniref:flagellar hook-associated protein FlgK n=1 Tax=Paenibacillus alkalitolerans TaxID=2799335 RepID=UPI0018F3ABA0|nr:flagellar hook-associated protein FlgK [Paenibacillus alkalitolerans]